MTAPAGVELVLTDDELVSLALARRASWPTPLPTVRSTVEDLGAAAYRGLRSLHLRRDAIDGALLDTWIDAAMRGTVRVAVVPPSLLERVVLHAGNDSVVRERITVDGRHAFDVVTAEQAVDAVLAALTGPQAQTDATVSVDDLDGERRTITVPDGDEFTRRRSVLAASPLLRRWAGLP